MKMRIVFYNSRGYCSGGVQENDFLKRSMPQEAAATANITHYGFEKLQKSSLRGTP